jgi:uncharacterized linocin/CFP29 family protein
MSDVQTGGQVGVNASIDIVQGGNGQVFAGGTVAQRLLASNFDHNILRPCAQDVGNGLTVNGTLLEDEWKLFDRTVQQVSREKLVAVTDLIRRGLVMDLPNALGVMSIEWEQVKGDLLDAEVTMSGLSEAQKDRMEFETLNMPIPLFHKEFFYNLRHLAAARRNGRQPDQEHAQIATRKIAERIEGTLFNGLTVGGSTIYGLLTHPLRKTYVIPVSWLTATGEQVVADIIAMLDVATRNPNNMEGPFILYVPTLVAARWGADYKANSDKTILQRIKEIPGISDILMTNRLSGSNILLVQATSDVVQMINGIQPTMVEWESHGGFQHNFKIIAIMLPRVRSNGWAQSGIVHAAPA